MPPRPRSRKFEAEDGQAVPAISAASALVAGELGRSGRAVRPHGAPVRSFGRAAGRARKEQPCPPGDRGGAIRDRTAGAGGALHPEGRRRARAGHGLLGRQPQRRPRHCRCPAVPEAGEDHPAGHGGAERTGKSDETSRVRDIARHPSPATASRSRSSRSSHPTPRPRMCCCRMRQIPRPTSWCWAATAILRLREFVLGGVTRSILAAMTAPTLMSHLGPDSGRVDAGLSVVMPGLVPGTHVFRATKQGVGGRDIRAFTPVFDGLCPAMTCWLIQCKRNLL